MALARTQREWAILVGEYNICKKKLESKREALKIITKEWQSSQRESDIYKNKINQLQQELDRYRLMDKKRSKEKQQKGVEDEKHKHGKNANEVNHYLPKDCLSQLTLEYKEENKALRKDLLALKKLYVESQEDVQILRDRMRRQSSSSSTGEEGLSTSVVDGKQELILQLEEYKEQVANLEQELKSVRDENSDVLTERDHYKDKCERLNTQLNYILSADDRRLVDVDALVLDNKYLKEKLALLEEERNLEKESIQKYEAVFEKKKNKLLHRGSIGERASSYYSKYHNDHSVKTIADLRNVANVLSETISEKNLALSHQRNANRILGKRVSELENKLKTLEVAGLWSLPGHRGYGSINFDCNDLDENHVELNGVTRPSSHKEIPDCSLASEFAGSEKPRTKMEINGNDFGDYPEALDVSRRIEYLETPDKISGLKAQCCISVKEPDSNIDNSGCQNVFASSKVLGQSPKLEELCTKNRDSSFDKESSPSRAVHENSEEFLDSRCVKKNSENRKLSRSSSAPCLVRTEFSVAIFSRKIEPK